MANIIVRDLSKNEYVASAQVELDIELNGNQVLKMTITPNKVNRNFIDDIEPMWEIDFQNNTYKIVYANKITKGNSFYLDIRAVHLALDKIDSIRTYERYDGSYTAAALFNIAFEGTGYTFSLNGQFSSIEIEGFGNGETKLESFKRLLKRYNAEFYISGSTFYITKYVGRDTSFEYRYRLNAANIKHEHDGTSTATYVRGFGDYDENEQDFIKKAEIKLTYESPLAKIIGRRHAPIVAKGSYKNEETVQAAMEKVLEESIVISVSADVKDLRKQGYPFAQPEVGDRVFLVDERIGFNQEIRIVKIVTQWFANGNIRDIQVTFGNEKLGKNYASGLSSMKATINALLDGSMTLPFGTLDARARDMLEKIMSVDTELTLDNGIYAVDKNDPNKVVGLNSAGWFISKDGGNTATVVATADGLVADYITTGVLHTGNVLVEGDNGLLWMSGSEIAAIGRDNDSATHLRPNGLSIKRPDGVWATIDGIPNYGLSVQRNVFMDPNIEWDGQNYITRDQFYRTFENFYIYHDARYLSAAFAVSLASSSSNSSGWVKCRIQEFGSSSVNQVGEVSIAGFKDGDVKFDGVTIDLGPPTYKPRQFYLQFAIRDSSAVGKIIPKVRTNRVYMKG